MIMLNKKGEKRVYRQLRANVLSHCRAYERERRTCSGALSAVRRITLRHCFFSRSDTKCEHFVSDLCEHVGPDWQKGPTPDIPTVLCLLSKIFQRFKKCWESPKDRKKAGTDPVDKGGLESEGHVAGLGVCIHTLCAGCRGDWSEHKVWARIRYSLKNITTPQSWPSRTNPFCAR